MPNSEKGKLEGEDASPSAVDCYALGDLVRHRASEKKAVVIDVEHRCITHPPLALCMMRLDRKDCVMEPTGTYSLSYNFDEEENGIDGLLLEKA